MQSLYALEQTKSDNLDKEEKFLLFSIDQMYDLFLINLQLLVEIRKHAVDFLEKSQKKYLATSEEKNPNQKFINNEVLLLLEKNTELKEAMDHKKMNCWDLDDEYVKILWKEISTSELYSDYMDTKMSSFKEDKDFILDVFKEIIAPNDKLYEYIEDKKLTWIDDLPLINTGIIKMLRKVKQTHDEHMSLPRLYKDADDKKFAKDIFRKTALNGVEFAKEIEGKTPNWDKDRIAELDKAVIKMAICEFQKFPSIPVKVTINEYLEIAKEYSTPKSSIFINGILDKISKEYQENGKLNKVGRGLM
ncbi:transcription antitermination factor NusB [Aquimarina sp. AD1]|uniref:transcription antitermination factor NusB n=1 Tax=unclassified Aquimarina TaxID=2627091 RepID=UPI000E497D31|nr:MULTISPECIES: transcription antitermination factor NusB [unclassified Aquimarina]AXT58493.1 transcription antitermination factor NusB [Aquimarina sp. AD1]RKN37582.1 transcription antitermination factor NusB [Aquimarina sp. AD1]